MTPALQSITNALNATISHFEEMERASRNSMDLTAFAGARQELRNAEATIVEMEEAFTGVSRTGAAVSRSLNDVGLRARNAGQDVNQVLQAIQQQSDVTNNVMTSTGETMGNVIQMMERQTAAIIDMSNAMSRIPQMPQTQRRQRQQTPQAPQMPQAPATTQQVGLLQRLYTRIASTVQGIVQRHERLRAVLQGVARGVSPIWGGVKKVGGVLKTILTTIIKIPSHAYKAVGAFHSMVAKLKDATTQSNSLLSTMKGIAGTYLSLKGISLAAGLSDNITSINARLGLMNDGLKTTQALSDVISRASFESGASYIDTASSIAKMGLNAGSAFNNNNELIAFMEQINKMFAIGGATSEEQSNAMTQLTQAMAAGALRGEELNSILDGAPGIARNIEKYMGWAEGSIKSYAEEGEVTAQVVKNAMLSMAEETNANFDKMPTTISRTFEKLKTLAIKSFTPVLQGINNLFNNQNADDILYQWGAVFQYIADRANVTIEKLKNIVNSEQFIKFSQDITTAFSAAGAAVTWGFDGIVDGFSYVVDNWESLQPVLTGVAVAFGVVTAAQWALNIAMYANPTTLVVLGIGALIVLLYKLVDRINKTKNKTISATGIIAGVIAGVYTVVRNTIANIWNVIATVGNTIYNFSKNGIDSIKVLFIDLANVILSEIQTIIQAIKSLTDHVPHIPIVTDGIEKFDGWLTKARTNLSELSRDIKNDMGYEEFFPKMEHKNVDETVDYIYHKVAGFGEGVKEFMENFDPWDGIETTNDLLADVLKNMETTAKNTDKIEGKLERSKEDLEFLRTVANIKYGDKYVMPQVKIEMTNNNTIQKEMDLDGFFDKKVEEMSNILQMSAEGVHI